MPARCALAAVEAALAGKPLDAASIAGAAGRLRRDLGDDVLGDIFASAEYRRRWSPVPTSTRALTAAAARA